MAISRDNFDHNQTDSSVAVLERPLNVENTDAVNPVITGGIAGDVAATDAIDAAPLEAPESLAAKRRRWLITFLGLGLASYLIYTIITGQIHGEPVGTSILVNPVFIGVAVMLILCLIKVNVMLSLMTAAVIAGLSAGMTPVATMQSFIDGMAGKNNIVLSYLLLGTLAMGIQQSGIVTILCHKLLRLFGTKRTVTVLVLAGVASLSQNLIPVHIAFIPILIPPLLYVFNKMNLDRRAVATALTFGLKAPYMVVPVGFGLVFGGLIADNMTEAGMAVSGGDVWRYLLIPVLGMFLGLMFSVFVSYRKPRFYQDRNPELAEVSPSDLVMTRKHWFTLIAIVIAFGTQVAMRMTLNTGLGLHLGALVAIIFMVATGVIPFRNMDSAFIGGVKLMGTIAFTMLMAGGFAGVIRETDGVSGLVSAITSVTGTNQLLLAFAMVLIGLVITMGIGTSFGTVPILAAIFVPLAAAGGFSVAATVCLIGTAAALGDAGSPASDSTLGPTVGLAADGQHDHIYDTCVPTFLHFDIPLVIFGTLAAAFIL
jgi:putative amino acid transporter